MMHGAYRVKMQPYIMSNNSSGGFSRQIKNILLLESVAGSAHSLLDSSFNVLPSSTPFTGLEVAKEHSIHAMVTRGKGDVSAQLIDACPDLEVIARCGVGLDNIDVAYATEKGIKVVNTPGVNAATVAEHSIALMLMLQRNLYQSVKAVKDNKWDYRTSYQGDEIGGKRLGIFGLGDIGGRVAQIAREFGMEVASWQANRSKASQFTRLALEPLLRQSDIISLHLPLVKNTHHLIGAKELAMLPDHALIVNTSRGAIIDQDALIDALHNKTIGGFAADVLETEPPDKNHPLLQMPNVLITPHSASLTATTYENICVISAKNVVDLLNGKTIEPKYIFNQPSV